MTTIPIEVIIQDAESPVTPTPTPESGGETNITVPDTGTISDGGSNGGGIESSASIILPAIIAVLAIGAIVAMLVHKHNKHQNDKLSKKEKLATVASSTIAILAATVLVGNLVMPATNAATSVEPGTAELETEDKITIIATREQDSDEAVVATVKNTSYATANLDFGYKVTASMAEGLDNANLYLDGDETSEYYFSPVEGGTLENNTWGYTLEEPSEDTSYLSIPLEDTPTTIVKGTNEIEDEPVDIYYTIKADKTLPAGTYSGELRYDILPLEPIEALTYLQDFANLDSNTRAAVFNSMVEDKQYYLKDSRDNKTYRISKLKDGNIWMTQNIDLQAEDLLPGVAIDSTNTDNPANGFALPASQVDGDESWLNTSDFEGSINTSHIYDSAANGGEYRYCLDYPGWGCAEYGEEISLDDLGNLYNWYTATAGTGTFSLTGGDVASGSICPAGWRLPSGTNTSDSPTDYSELLYIYDITQSPNPSAAISGMWSKIYENPLLLVPASQYDSGFRNDSVGISGTLWTSLAASDKAARPFSFSPDNLSHLSFEGKVYGYSVRCLVRE